MQVTKRVFSLNKFFKSEGRSFGFDESAGVHHFMVKFCWAARSIQGAMLASWSMDERMNSEPGAADSNREWERLRKSWDVDEPRTVYRCLGRCLLNV